MNLNLHRKLRQLGVLALPMDFLPVDQVDHLDEIKPMYWRFGQKILGVAELIRKDPRLYGIYITNFGCGPDSFIQHFFKDRMRGKPYLEIEIDEHSSDVGAITRLEAFLDSLKNVTVEPAPVRLSPYRYRVTGNLKRKIYLPPMTDQALAMVAAFQACGGEAEALPPSDDETLELGRRLTSGKECYPLILTTGDLAKLVQRPDFEPGQERLLHAFGRRPLPFRPVPPLPPPGAGRPGVSPGAGLLPGPERKHVQGIGPGGRRLLPDRLERHGGHRSVGKETPGDPAL